MQPAKAAGAPDGLMSLWAKSRSENPDQQGYHPLLYHLTDVAMVARCMWELVLPLAERERVSRCLGLTEAQAGPWVAFLAGTHDIGKASPCFEQKDEDPVSTERLRGAGFGGLPVPNTAPHGSTSARALRSILSDGFRVPEPVSSTLAAVVGGHHGSIPSGNELRQLTTRAMGGTPWTEAREDLATILAGLLSVPEQSPSTINDATALWLAGFISVADWIGSSEQFFPFVAPSRAVAPEYDPAYIGEAYRRAHQALESLGWLAQPTLVVRTPFREMFGYEPNDMQQAVMQLQPNLTEPGLVIIEAPMGVGKTEAGLWLAESWREALGQRGFYVALPTQATSDQMFDRVAQFLARRYSDDAINVQLLHGHAGLSAAFAEMRRNGYRTFLPGQVGEDGARAGVAAAEWFTYRKRGLLAPFGIGTIDQVLLAVLQAKHGFVRLFGLAQKTIVIDEVHAYDTYMSTLLERLLNWLAALGSSVVLLSATLPNERRVSLARAYAEGLAVDTPAVPGVPYPRLTSVSASRSIESRPIPTDERTRHTVSVEWIEPLLGNDGSQLGARLREALEGGGTAAVICNTVRRAQDVYCALKPYFPGSTEDGEPELDLLHARYRFEERQTREKRTLLRFGKPGVLVDDREVLRPHRAVLVSTQIIEQSLDLDFDLMVTDLAPVDLVLQRVGRLWRHERGIRSLSGPDLWIGSPEGSEVPIFDRGSEHVYFPHVLLRSWLALRSRKTIAIPDDVEELVEAVYSAECPWELSDAQQRRWKETLAQQEKALASERVEAGLRYIAAPETEEYIWEVVGIGFEEDAPDLHPRLQALTRLTQPSVSTVILTEDEAVGFDPRKNPEGHTLRWLLRRSLTISDRRVVFTLAQQEPPSGWQRSPMLRHERLLTLNSDSRTQIGGHTMRLDPELGLVIEE